MSAAPLFGLQKKGIRLFLFFPLRSKTFFSSLEPFFLFTRKLFPPKRNKVTVRESREVLSRGLGRTGTWGRMNRDEEPTAEGDGVGSERRKARGGRLDGPGRLFGRPEASEVKIFPCDNWMSLIFKPNRSVDRFGLNMVGACSVAQIRYWSLMDSLFSTRRMVSAIMSAMVIWRTLSHPPL